MNDDIDYLIRAMGDLEDRAVCLALADRLDELGHPLAADIRHLASVVPVFPPAPPDHNQCYPMACGSWWEIARALDSVRVRVYPNAPGPVLGANLVPASLTSDSDITPEVAFEFQRRRLLSSLFDYDFCWPRSGRLGFFPRVANSEEDDEDDAPGAEPMMAGSLPGQPHLEAIGLNASLNGVTTGSGTYTQQHVEQATQWLETNGFHAGGSGDNLDVALVSLFGRSWGG